MSAEYCPACIYGRGKHLESCDMHVLPGCRCSLTKLERWRGEPHATECPLSKKAEAA